MHGRNPSPLLKHLKKQLGLSLKPSTNINRLMWRYVLGNNDTHKPHHYAMLNLCISSILLMKVMCFLGSIGFLWSTPSRYSHWIGNFRCPVVGQRREVWISDTSCELLLHFDSIFQCSALWKHIWMCSKRQTARIFWHWQNGCYMFCRAFGAKWKSENALGEILFFKSVAPW